MNKTVEFLKHSVLAKRGAKKTIEKIKDIVVWKNNCKVLDVGCGPGNVTHDFLLPILPKSTDTIIAVDNQSDAIEYASTHFGKQSKIIFKELDIVKDTLQLQNYANYFDYIFSFYCLHFIKEHEIAIKNIYNALKPGGDFFFSCVVHINLADIAQYVSKTPEWAQRVPYYREYLFDYQFSPNPTEDLKEDLSKIGFKNIHTDITIESEELLLPFETITEFIVSHLPFFIPPTRETEYGLSFMDAARKLKFNRFDEENKECCHVRYKTIFAHVSKPLVE